MIVVLAVTRSTAKNWARYAGFVLVVLVVGLATGFLGSASQDFANRPDTVSEREDLTAEALDSFAESDGLGIGLGSQLADTELGSTEPTGGRTDRSQHCDLAPG